VLKVLKVFRVLKEPKVFRVLKVVRAFRVLKVQEVVHRVPRVLKDRMVCKD
jgi:hypothetical protein